MYEASLEAKYLLRKTKLYAYLLSAVQLRRRRCKLTCDFRLPTENVNSVYFRVLLKIEMALNSLNPEMHLNIIYQFSFHLKGNTILSITMTDLSVYSQENESCLFCEP
jgi:hypothetical protein